MAKLLKQLICWVFGECWQTEESRARIDNLSRRVGRLEQGVQREQEWRPSDVFRPR